MPSSPPQETTADVRLCTKQLDVTLTIAAIPAFSAATREGLRPPLPGSGRSGGRTLPDGRVPVPGGHNRILLTGPKLTTEIGRSHEGGGFLRGGSIINGSCGSHILVLDPAGNPIELFQPAP